LSAHEQQFENQDDEFERYKLYWEERRYIIQSKKEEEQKLIDTLLTLSTASIGLFCSLVFFKDSSLSELSQPRLAVSGLILMGLCCVICVSERWVSHKAYDQILLQLKPDNLFDPPNPFPKHSKLISELYIYAFMSFISGGAFMGWALITGRMG
jgi:hypothetical protein